MTLAIALTVNAILIVALLGGLAFAMSLPRKLTPHAGAREAPRPRATRSRATRTLTRRVPVTVGS